LGFTIANLFAFPPEIAAGVILIGCAPSGLASNVMSFLAKANLALSITITALAPCFPPFLTPVLAACWPGNTWR
jgi:BASS family bile acid:Na+ symporter